MCCCFLLGECRLWSPPPLLVGILRVSWESVLRPHIERLKIVNKKRPKVWYQLKGIFWLISLITSLLLSLVYLFSLGGTPSRNTPFPHSLCCPCLQVPVGTIIREHPSRDILHDLLLPDSSCVVAAGGEGGMGNAIFSTLNRKPVECTPGDLGEEKVIEVELQTITDLGLVGLPNAGKSTLLQALSHTIPKVAAYPFTTLNPQVGVVVRGPGEEEEDLVTGGRGVVCR